MVSVEERTLESRFDGVFRRMWISYSPRNNGLQVIAFPIDRNKTYVIFTKSNTPIWKKARTEDGKETRTMDIDVIERMVRDEMKKDGKNISTSSGQ